MSGVTIVRRGVVILAAAMTLVGAVPAQAAVASHITAAYNGTTANFHGRVSSGNAECIAHRTVKLFKQTASGNVLVGTTSSRTGGGWTIHVMSPHGRYFAKTPRQKEMTILCGRALSNIVHVM